MSTTYELPVRRAELAAEAGARLGAGRGRRATTAPSGARARPRAARGLERQLDGSGYPRGLSGAGISREARVLAAADAYQAMREPRPHRPERSAEEAAAELRADVKAGRQEGDAVEAVLGAAGHRVMRRLTHL